MSNIKYPFKSQDVSSTGFGVREKPDHNAYVIEKIHKAYVRGLEQSKIELIDECERLEARVKELKTIEDEFARFRDKVRHIDNWSRHMPRGQILKDIHEMLMPFAMVVDASKKEASHE